MSSGAAAPPNFGQAAQQQSDASQQNVNQQTQTNRPNQYNPFASTTWSQGPGGQWSQSTQFAGPLSGLSSSLQQQAAEAMGSPFSLSGLPQLTDGSAAREQAINAAYGSATSRLDPQFQQREEQMRLRLQQQGLAPGSEAYEREIGNLSRERSDAYTQALANATSQGTSAGQALFNQSLAGRQNALAEALRQRGQAMGDLQGLMGLTQQQGFMGAGQAQAPDTLGALSTQYQSELQRQAAEQQFWAQIIGAGVQAGGAIGGAAMMACDARAKQDISPVDSELMPGVPRYRWRYLPEFGDPSKVYEGVLAQDLQRVAPGAVYERPSDGMLFVDAVFAPVEIA
jgi:hypothetical protein